MNRQEKNDNLPERLREVLSSFSLTNQKLADLVGISQPQISHWLSGRNSMPQSTAMAFQSALGIRWQWLIHGEGEMMLAKAAHLPADLKELADLWPRLSEADRQYVLGVAEGRAAKKGK